MIKSESKGASRVRTQSQSPSFSKLINLALLCNHRAPILVLRADLLIAKKRTKFPTSLHD